MKKNQKKGHNRKVLYLDLHILVDAGYAVS